MSTKRSEVINDIEYFREKANRCIRRRNPDYKSYDKYMRMAEMIKARSREPF